MKLTGVIPANLLPFNADLSIDEAAYRQHIESLVAVDGVTGIVSNGHAAEVASLTPAERERALAISVEVVNRRIPVISGLYAENAQSAASYARRLVGEGADALLVFPPSYYNLTSGPGTAAAYFADIASATDVPLVVFLYPDFTKMQYPMAELTKIFAVSSVVAVKDWSLDIRVHDRIRQVIAETGRDIHLLTSFSTNLLPALASGADGIVSGHGSVVAPLQVELFSAVSRNDLPAARRVYAALQPYVDAVYSPPLYDMYARMKLQLSLDPKSPIAPRVRPPLKALTVEQCPAVASLAHVEDRHRGLS